MLLPFFNSIQQISLKKNYKYIIQRIDEKLERQFLNHFRTNLFSNSDISVSKLRCHFSACENNCFRRRIFVWVEFSSSLSTSLVTDSLTASIISSTSSAVKVSSLSRISLVSLTAALILLRHWP